MSNTSLAAPFLPLTTLDPTAPIDDLEPLAELIGDTRVVAIGESTHGNHEFYQLRHRLARFLVERLGFTAVAFEGGFPEGFLTDAWINGANTDLDTVVARGFTYGLGQCDEMRVMLTWLREHNAAHPGSVRFYGADLPGSSGSFLPALDAIEPYLSTVDPAFLPHLARLRELASLYAKEMEIGDDEFPYRHIMAAMGMYATLPAEQRDEMTGLLTNLSARFDALRPEYIERSDATSYDLARQQVRVAAQLDMQLRAFAAAAAGDASAATVNARDLAMADTVEWILQREDRIVLMEHNGHIQRVPFAVAGMTPAPSRTMGYHLASRLGKQYFVIGTTFGSGRVLNFVPDQDGDTPGMLRPALFEIPPATTETIDGLIGASQTEIGFLDLRTLNPEDAALVDAATRMRALTMETEPQPARQAFDLLAYIPHITPWHSILTAHLQQSGEPAGARG